MTPLRFSSVSIAHFRSFAEEQTISLSRSPGVYHLRGVNHADPKISPNGIGKSSLIDAVCFALYGKTVKGTRGPDLRNWDTGGQAVVTLAGVVGRRPFTIKRTIGPNSLLLAKTSDELGECDQDEIDRLIGLSYETFSLCVVNGQATSAFLDYGATQQLETLSTLLGLDRYAEAGDRASKHTNRLSDKIGKLEQERSYGRGERKGLSREVEELENDEHSWVRDRLLRLKVLVASHRDEHARASRLQEDVAEHAVLVQRETEAKKRDLDEASLDLTEASAALSRCKDARKREGERFSKLNFAISTTKVCPTCKRPYGADEDVTSRMRDQLVELERELGRLDDDVRKLSPLAQAAEALVASRREALNNAERPFQEKGKRLHQAWVEAQTKVNVAESEIGSLLKQTSPYKAKLEAKEALLRDVRERLASLDGDIEVLTAERELHRYWIKGFKDLRLSVTEQALTHLTLNVNSALTALGLVGWLIEVRAESTGKTGNVKRGMTILAGKNGEMRPVSLYSEGERQRLRLAVALGFASLVQSSSGVNVNVEFHDEPSSWLSAGGVTDLLKLLDERARQTRRTIYVADHRSLDYPFMGAVELIKDEEGTHAA